MGNVRSQCIRTHCPKMALACLLPVEVPREWQAVWGAGASESWARWRKKRHGRDGGGVLRRRCEGMECVAGWCAFQCPSIASVQLTKKG